MNTVLLAAALAASAPSAASVPARKAAHPIKPRESAAAYRYAVDELFSLRERRRFAAYLRMRLLELREAGLARAADAIRRRLPVDVLVGPTSPP